MLRTLIKDPLYVGAAFPPISQRERINDYDSFYGLFMGQHSDVFAQQFMAIEPTRRTNVWICLNIPRFISNIWADLLFGEPPLFASDNKDQQSFLDKITKDGSIFRDFHSWCVDVSRYGDGVMRILKKHDNSLGFAVQPPQYWFPVVNPRDIKDPVEHIFAWRFQDDALDTLVDNGMWHMLFDKFVKDSVTGNVNLTSGQYLISGRNGFIVKLENTFNDNQNTNMKDFPIVHVSNFESSDSLFGISDIDTIDSPLSEIENRFSQISAILDKHASPAMQGPSNLIVRDENGNNPHVEISDDYIGRDSDDVPVEYLTWDGQLTAAYKEIDELWSFIIKTAEVSPALFGGDFGRAESGSAMKRLLLQTIIKVNRLRLSFDPAIKKLLLLYSQAALQDGVEGAVLLDSVDIQWRDGLPQDITEEVQADTMAVSGGISSVESAVSRAWNKTGDQLKLELEKIETDAKKKSENVSTIKPINKSPIISDTAKTNIVDSATANNIKKSMKEQATNVDGKNI